MNLGAITFFARDVDALATFYADGLGLDHVVNDSPRYRELAGGGANIGFAFPGAYELLALQDEMDPTGLRGVITFTLPDSAAMDDAVARAVTHGATVAKPPYETHFGKLMVVLRDPEGNAFRLTAALPA